MCVRQDSTVGVGFRAQERSLSMHKHTDTYHTNAHTHPKEKAVGYKTHRDYAARHQREPNSSVYLSGSVQCPGRAISLLVFTEQTGYLIWRNLKEFRKKDFTLGQ